MKKVLLILLMVSCSTAKDKIVEEQEWLQNEIESTETTIDELKEKAHKMSNNRNVDSIMATGYMRRFTSLLDTAARLSYKKALLKTKYDSLEKELKKY